MHGSCLVGRKPVDRRILRNIILINYWGCKTGLFDKEETQISVAPGEGKGGPAIFVAPPNSEAAGRWAVVTVICLIPPPVFATQERRRGSRSNDASSEGESYLGQKTCFSDIISAAAIRQLRPGQEQKCNIGDEFLGLPSRTERSQKQSRRWVRSLPHPQDTRTEQGTNPPLIRRAMHVLQGGVREETLRLAREMEEGSRARFHWPAQRQRNGKSLHPRLSAC